MYSKEFWDGIYKNQVGTLPRLTETHKNNATDFLQKYLPQNLKWKNILDYWCWNGHIWEKFLYKWANVDFAEISDKMIELLKRKFLYSNKIYQALSEWDLLWKTKIFGVSTPKDLLDKWLSYDYIVAWALFHHINPNLRSEFLGSFNKLLKKDWTLIIAWWDESDIILKQDKNIWHITWQPCFTLNNISKYLDGDKYEIKETWILKKTNPAFDIPRIFRHYVIKKI